MKGTRLGKVLSVKFSPDGGFLFSAGREVIAWDLSSGRESFRFENPAKKAVIRVGFSAGGTTLIGITETGVILEWDIRTRKLLRQIQDSDKTEFVFSADVSFDGKLVALGTELSQVSDWGQPGARGGSRGGPVLGADKLPQTGQRGASGLFRLDSIKTLRPAKPHR